MMDLMTGAGANQRAARQSRAAKTSIRFRQELLLEPNARQTPCSTLGCHHVREARAGRCQLYAITGLLQHRDCSGTIEREDLAELWLQFRR